MTERHLDPDIRAALEAMSPEDRLEAALRLMEDAERGFSQADVTAAYDAQLTNAGGLPSGSDTSDTSGQANQSDDLEKWLAQELEKLNPEYPGEPDSPKKPVSPADADADGNGGIGSGNPVMGVEQLSGIYAKELRKLS